MDNRDYSSMFESKYHKKSTYHRDAKQMKDGYNSRFSYTSSNLRLFGNSHHDKIRQSHYDNKYQHTCRKSRNFDKYNADQDVSTLPYYIVPVLYVPRKHFYDEKQAIQPQVYRAYHCKSKNQLCKSHHDNIGSRSYFTKSKSLLNVYSAHRRDRDRSHNRYSYSGAYTKNNDDYSFECYDRYFRKYVDTKPIEKTSASEISFCTEASYPDVQCEKKPTHFDDNFEKICNQYETTNELLDYLKCGTVKDDPPVWGVKKPTYFNDKFDPFYEKKYDLYGSNFVSNSKCEAVKNDPPTWDIPKHHDAVVATEYVTSSVSIQTSMPVLDTRTYTQTQGTQTVIKDISKVVVTVPSEKIQRSVRQEPIAEELSLDIENSLAEKLTVDKRVQLGPRRRSGVPRLIPRRINKLSDTSNSSVRSSKDTSNTVLSTY